MTVEEWLGKDNQLGIDIWHNKYQYNNETFDEWLDRVSANDQDVKRLIIEKKFLFGGRILASRGIIGKDGIKASLSNCYMVEPPADNIESIFDCAKKIGRTYSYGGGCGTDISNLSPKGAKVNNAARTTSGSISFMALYNLVTELIGQSGRRGALIITISCEHPDLIDFIKIKTDLDSVTKANISIRMTDAFMEAVEQKKKFMLRFEREETGEVIEKEVDAYEVFKLIAETNWDYAEPGVLYWDTISKGNMLSEDPSFEYAGVNPCGEVPLPAGGACLLGSLNLSEFINDDLTFNSIEFAKCIKIAVRALNDVLEEGLSWHPLEEQRKSVGNWRQIGLGIMGLGDMLIKMHIRYGSEESIEICNKIGHTLARTALIESINQACSKNSPYPRFHTRKIQRSSFFKKHISRSYENKFYRFGMRNSQLLAIAPTGTLSTMLQISGGIEPIFDISYDRKTETLQDEEYHYKIYTPIVKEYMEANGITDEKNLPEWFVTAKSIPYKERIDMQSIWQSHIDGSISSTVNLPHETTVEEIMDLYMYAWKKKLKGVTVFREGCKRLGVLTTDRSNEDKDNADQTGDLLSDSIFKYDSIEPITRKDLGSPLPGNTYIKKVACGTMYITINHDAEGNMLEVFVDSGKSGGCSANAECIGRYASAALRSGVKVESVVDITQGVKCSACIGSKGKGMKLDGISCGDVIAKTIKEEYEFLKNMRGKGKDIEIDPNVKFHPAINSDHKSDCYHCPECGSDLAFEGGCKTCRNCGWSKCD